VPRLRSPRLTPVEPNSNRYTSPTCEHCNRLLRSKLLKQGVRHIAPEVYNLTRSERSIDKKRDSPLRASPLEYQAARLAATEVRLKPRRPRNTAKAPNSSVIEAAQEFVSSSGADARFNTTLLMH
jgi:hypothetical protein